MSDSYDVSGSAEGQYQPGSDNRVTLNKRNIINPDEMDDVELHLLHRMQRGLLDEIEVTQTITSTDLCNWHQRWLGSVYHWAGRYRTVNMQKDGFPFAAATRIPYLMEDFDWKLSSLLRSFNILWAASRMFLPRENCPR